MRGRKLLFRLTLVVSLLAGIALMLYDAGDRYNFFKDSLARDLVVGKTNKELIKSSGYIEKAAPGKDSGTDIFHESLSKEKQALGAMDVVTGTRFAVFMATFFLVGFVQVWILYFLIMLGLTSKKRR